MYNNGYYQQNQYPYQQQGGYNQNQQYQQYQQGQQSQQQMQPNMNFIPMYFVSGPEDVKKYIVMPNQMAYFKDINSNIVYEKRADNFSNYTTKPYELRELTSQTQNESQYALKSEIEALQIRLDEVYSKIGGVVNEQPK